MVTIGDYDVDGFMDLFLTNGINLVPRERGGPSTLIRNTSPQSGNTNRWMLIDLEGTNSNRDGIGATIHVTTPDNDVQLREQNGGYHRTAQNHKRLHFGLGSNNKADVTIRWPSGRVDTHEDVAANKLYRATEGGLDGGAQSGRWRRPAARRL